MLVDETDRVFEQLQQYPVNSLVDLLPEVSSNCGAIMLDNSLNCSLQGVLHFVC